MAFEKGNSLGEKGRLFDQALRRAIAQDSGVKLRAAADKLLDCAANGEAWAINTLADRLDGKATQQVTMSVKDERADELDDNSLLRIAARGSNRAAEAQSGAEVPTSLH